MPRLLKPLRRQDLPLLILLVAILLIRILWVLLASPPVSVNDSVFYDRAAHWFMQSGTFAVSEAMRPSAWQMPGYPFFLSLIYWVFGLGSTNLIAVRLVQAVLSVLTILVLYRIALRLKGRKLGIAVVVLAGLYPSFTFANQYIVTEVLYTFLLSLVVLFGVRLLGDASWKNACSFGVLLALAAYVRPAGVIWGVMPFLLLLGKVPFRRLLALSAIGLLAFCLCMSPWWIRSEHIYHRFVAFSTSSTDPLLAGTYVMYDATEETYEQLPRDILVWTSGEMQDLTPEAELQASSHYKELAVARVKDQLRNHPGTFLYGRLNATAGSFRAPHFLPELPVFAKKAAKWAQFLFLLIPAFVALWVGRKDRRVLLLASLPVLVGIAYAAILISPRYVFPLMPMVILMAAMGWLHLIGWVSARRRRNRDARQATSG